MSKGIRVFWLAAFLASAACVVPAQGAPLGYLHQMLPTDSDPTKSVALGDVDADGDLDVFLGQASPDRLYLNDGRGSFTDVTASHLPSLSSNTTALALGDVDGDGDEDAVLGAWNQQNRLLLNDGTGHFADATTGFPVDSDKTSVVALVDVNGDGYADIVLGNSGQQNRLYLGSGMGFTASAAHLPVDTDTTTSLATGDVDGDGDPDILVGNTGQQSRLYLNDGSGTFTDYTAVSLPVEADWTGDVTLADVDGDGDLDAIVANRWQITGFGPNRLYLNDGSGTFQDATLSNLPLDSDEARSVEASDVDGDGDLDLLFGNIRHSTFSPEGQNRLYLNDGLGFFTDVTTTGLPSIPDDTLDLALGDLDGDGDPDVVAGNWREQNRLFLNTGVGTFQDCTARGLPADPTKTPSLALGDVDGDGYPDILVGKTWPTYRNRVYVGDGSGGFTEKSTTSLPLNSDNTAAVYLADVDADGDLDALIGNHLHQNRLYLNDGTGMFIDATVNLPGDADATKSLALGDLDGDGDLDLLLANTASASRHYRNDGTGVFTDVTAATLFGAAWRTVALDDVDGDGDLDAFIGKGPGVATGAQNRLYLNDGGGSFTQVTSTHLPAQVNPTYSVALGDVDGDGDPDALIGNGIVPFGGGAVMQNRLYLNDGSGIFTEVTASHLPTDADQTHCVALGDMDGDGDLDAFVGNWYGPNRLYTNDGAGFFTDVTTAQLAGDSNDTMALDLGDVDGDGDLDCLVGIDGQDRLCTNLGVQLAWRGVPRFGKPLTIDLFGPPDEPWILGASTGVAEIPSPSWGTLRLNPLDLIEITQGTFDAQGRASLIYMIAPDPGGAGLAIHGQALVGTAPWLTNRETFTFTDL